MKVRKKNCVFLGGHSDSENEYSLTEEIPSSDDMAAILPFVERASHGYEESGSVAARLRPEEQGDPAMFEEWIEQSYRAKAPNKSVPELDDLN